ncbi:MAG: sulfatase-like hydrolase/transferase [Kiritimatiellales bacterium]
MGHGHQIVLAGFSLATVCLHTDAGTQPNIIAVLVDDIGVGDFGFSGGLEIPTPNIDRLARGGVVFSNGYALPSCSPTRAALLTGRYPQRFGIEDNRLLDGPMDGMDVKEVTLADKLHDAGYHTRLIGKWHLGKGEHFEFAPRNRGFDEFYGYFGAAGRYVNPVLSRNGEEKERSGYITDILTDEACSFLKQTHEKPFFLHLAYMTAHLPQVAKPEKLKRFHYLMERRKYAAALISNLDDNIGRLLDTLDSTGLSEKTLIFFMSDNGGEPPILGTSNGPHRGKKFDVVEGGIRVPFAMRWTGVIPPGTVYNPMVHVFDIFTTSLAAAGVERPENVDGVDLLPFVLGQANGAPHERLFWRYNDHWEWRIPGRDTNLARPLRAVREGNWKLVIEGNNPPELYDLSRDAGEWTDLAADYPERVESMKKSYDEWYAQMIPQVVPDSHPLYGKYKFMKPKQKQ